MLGKQSIKNEGGTTRGVVLITLLLSLFAFSGFDSRGPSREIQSVKTELVVKTRRCTARAFYTVADQKSIFNFYPFRAIEFLRFQDCLIKTKMGAMAHQNLGVKKFFSRYYHLTYPSLSVEEDIIESLPG